MFHEPSALAMCFEDTSKPSSTRLNQLNNHSVQTHATRKICKRLKRLRDSRHAREGSNSHRGTCGICVGMRGQQRGGVGDTHAPDADDTLRAVRSHRAQSPSGVERVAAKMSDKALRRPACAPSEAGSDAKNALRLRELSRWPPGGIAKVLGRSTEAR